MTVNFDTTATEASQITDIADRYLELIGHPENLHMRLEVRMDLTACHLNGTPLRLAEMLEATDFELAHDVTGIQAHLDRGTGTLTLNHHGATCAETASESLFLPRFAQPEASKKAA